MAAGEHDERPWRACTILADEGDHKVERLVVAPGKRLSYQRHAHPAEVQHGESSAEDDVERLDDDFGR